MGGDTLAVVIDNGSDAQRYVDEPPKYAGIGTGRFERSPYERDRGRVAVFDASFDWPTIATDFGANSASRNVLNVIVIVMNDYHPAVIAGLDPAIHRFSQDDGCAGQARA